MTRLDPVKLLKCLSVLLSPTGGIKSGDELETLAKLMTTYSRKLVSKCIYIQILKCTETELLRKFMASGGWTLIHMWLTESIVSKNWPLLHELLELLLLCPVDIERLKSNNCPKLIKELSKDEKHLAIKALASKLVGQWLEIVKGANVEPIRLADIPQIIANATGNTTQSTRESVTKKDVPEIINSVQNGDNNIAEETQQSSDNVIIHKTVPVEDENKNDEAPQEAEEQESKNREYQVLPVLKISVKDGKQIISQVNDSESKPSKSEKIKYKSKERSSEKSSSKSSSSKSKSHSSSNSKHKSSSHRSSSPSRSHSKDKSKDKDRHSSHNTSNSSSSSSKSRHSDSSKRLSDKSHTSSNSKSSKDDKPKINMDKDKKDKEKDEKKKEKEVKVVKDVKNEKIDEKPSIHKLGKIPKLSEVKREKPSISIEVRKPDEPKPKTVKTFHSKFRKHGLEEEIKPPPSRATVLNKKATPPPIIPIPKRSSPVHIEPPPPEKKAKIIEPVDKPGAIKLIPPKPKPMMLLESDMFMDALNASATNKKEPKKRKRRTSGSKDGNNPNEASPPHTPTTVSSPSDNKSVPPRFYQDTLDAEEDKAVHKNDESKDNAEDMNSPEKYPIKENEPMETAEPTTLTVNGLKGVLCHNKRKGPKKSIKWKPDCELEEIQYFELDETERVNVTKTFTDMKHLERIHEREAFQKARNLINDDVMEEKTNWKPLIPISAEGQIVVEYGKNSKEKDIQAIRQKGTLQPLYFHKSMIPDSALEPEPETHLYSEPAIIPLDDITGNQDNISDFRNMPWPEPKGNAPPATNTNVNIPPMFPANMPQFPNAFPSPQFPGMPGFQGPGMMPNEWPNGVPPMMPNGIPGPGPMGGIPPGAMPPGMLIPPENMMMGPEVFNGPTPLFPPVPPEGFNMMEGMMGPNMFPPDFNMAGPQGPASAEGFPGGNFRGAMRGRGSGGHWRGKAPNNWEGAPPRGRGGHTRGGRVCIYFQRRGSCRQGDNCTFLHVNRPY